MTNYNIPIDVGKTTIGNVLVSTIILPYAKTAETMIFVESGEAPVGLEDHECERGPENGCAEQHLRWVERVTAAVNAQAKP